ncbi:MAG: ABC transporter ATP-binding protein [Deltaproteobacteria bacterium]|nr:ABC transporter ATP-binding protein [Deltaproteobacteria bacterium]
MIVLMLGGSFLEMSMIGLVAPLLDAATKLGSTSSSKTVSIMTLVLQYMNVSPTSNNILFALLILMSMVIVANGVVRVVQQYGSAYIAKSLNREVKVKLFQRILTAQYSYLAEKSRGALLYDINGPALSTFQVMNFLGMLIAAVCNAVVMTGFMFYLSWWVTVLIGLFGLAWVQLWRKVIDRRAVSYGRELYELESKASKIEVDSIDGLKVVKSYGLSGYLVKMEEIILRGQLRPHLQLILTTHGISLINDLMSSAIVILVGILTLGTGWIQMSFSTLVVFLLALRKVSPALSNINSAYAQLNKERKGIEMIDHILNSLPVEQNGCHSVTKVKRVEFKNLSFHYPLKPNQPVLNGIELVLKKGEITALVGSTGSGKSTLTSLLIGFYQPTQGCILVNDHDFADLNLEDWRHKIGYVSQDIFLFNDTIQNNILLWDKNISRAEMESAAKLAQLHDFILTLPEGYDTVVGDRGLKLSGGQAQRVAIARAILRKPEILIFDEATSALDNLTEKAVYNAISALRQNAVVLVIAHRLSTVRDADQIAVLEHGKITEIGSHDTLLNQKGRYSHLYHGFESEVAHAAD